MKQTIQIPPSVAADIASGYAYLKVALQFFRDARMQEDEGKKICPPVVAADLRRIAVNITNTIDIVDSRIPRSKTKEYSDQIKNNDHMRFPEVQRLMTRMTPEQQNMMEEVCIAILNKKLTIENIELKTAV